MIIGIIFCCVVLIVFALLNTENYSEQVAKIILMSGILITIITLVYNLSYNSGVKDGVHNQLIGKYEVTYVINKDSCVVDTIINVK